MSIARAITRSPADAIGRSRTTASGVTTPLGSVVPGCTLPRVQGPRWEDRSNGLARSPRASPLYSGYVDIDRFVTDNRSTWDRLGELTRRVNELSGDEVRELARLYQRTSGHLAYAQGHFSDPTLKAFLTNRVAQSAGALYGARRRSFRTFVRFFSETFPLAVWDLRWFVLASGLIFVVPALAVGTWIAHSSAAFNISAPAAVREAYVNHDFAAYYSSQPSVDFANEVYWNNVLVTFEAFAGGITFGLFTVFALFNNGLNLGVAGGLFYASHRPGEFWGLITPHGLLECTSVVLAGAAGLRIGWALIDPGDRSRVRALSEEGPRATVLVLGTVLTLAVAGSIEGFVTGSALPTAVRVGIGVSVEVAFLTWVVTRGRGAWAKRDRATYETEGPSELPGSLHAEVSVG
jgi:uncharacterized membrane protein SpoIIM required for sporulation